MQNYGIKQYKVLEVWVKTDNPNYAELLSRLMDVEVQRQNKELATKYPGFAIVEIKKFKEHDYPAVAQINELPEE